MISLLYASGLYHLQSLFSSKSIYIVDLTKTTSTPFYFRSTLKRAGPPPLPPKVSDCGFRQQNPTRAASAVLMLDALGRL